MGYKGTIGKTNWSLGEISPRSMGRFDQDKPIWKNGAAIIENMLIGQACSLANRPGTQYIAPTKFSTTAKSCLRRFTYSIAQEYILEIGQKYIRFFSNLNGSPGQVVVPTAPAWVTSTAYVIGNFVLENSIIYYCIKSHTSGTFATDLASGDWISQSILEIPTIFQQADIFNLQTANKADVMYITNPNYYPQKLIRTTATSFTIANVPFVRGPFLDGNTTLTTITPSAATNVGGGGLPYAVGTYVTNGGNTYICIVANISTTSFANDLAAGYWQLVNVGAIPAWASIGFYTVGNVVSYSGNYYTCVVNVSISPVTPNDDIYTSGFSNSGHWIENNLSNATAWVASTAFGTITLTASSPIFLPGHVGSLWWINNTAPWVDSSGNPLWSGACVLITAYSTSTLVTGIIQLEPDGTAGNIGGTSAYAGWSEGAFSIVRGYPSSVTFHEGRLVYGGTSANPQTLYGSVVGAYDNFSVGAATDSDAYQYEIAGTESNGIRWLDSDTSLELGTSGGTITAADGSTAVGISPTAPPNITFDSNYGVMPQQPVKLGGYLFYLEANGFYIRQLTYDLITSKYKSINMTLLADHILRDGLGAVQIASQISPYDRIWIVRQDGQIAVFTRDAEQQVEGWSRIVAGQSNNVNGIFESIDILPIDGQDDQVWVICNRFINGSYTRFVEVFTSELFDNYWEPVRLDASLSYDNVMAITGGQLFSGNFLLDNNGNIVFDNDGNPVMVN